MKARILSRREALAIPSTALPAAHLVDYALGEGAAYSAQPVTP